MVFMTSDEYAARADAAIVSEGFFDRNLANHIQRFRVMAQVYTEAYTDGSMCRIASVLAILILLLTAAPLQACMTGDVMSQEESACCRAMHGKCDGMEQMGCCRTEVRTEQHPQFAASAPVVDLHFTVVDWLEPFVIAAEKVPASAFGITDAHSPPGLVIARITVLRI